ncbi:aldo/keto reductase [Pseudonocardia ailaonensis]|uniref:Aldo/keto reductase n=1 Tax=Pseudonocardia ailaonensis TaxID=367279 RepID=A0ABN2N4B5_9PSEU
MSAFGLGCASFVSEARGVAVEEARQILRTALDEGIDFLDTANMYAGGDSERLIGEVVADRRSEYTLCTKVGVRLSDPTDTRTMTTDSTTDALLRQVEESLGRLRTDHVDYLLLHQFDPARSPQEQMESLAAVRERGLTRKVGFSNFPVDAAEAALSTGIAEAVEYSLNLIDDRNVPQLRAAGEHGCLRISFGTFAHGLLAEDLSATTEFGPLDWRRRSRESGDARTSGNVFYAGDAYAANLAVADALRGIGREHGFTLGELAVAALANLGLSDVVLLGCRSVAELRSNLDGGGKPLPEEAARAVREVLAACPTAPVAA